MRRLGIAVALAVLSLALGYGAGAQTATYRYVFVTVDAVATEANRIRVTGILEGEAAATEVPFVVYSSSSYGDAATYIQTCERKALLAMSKPGQYLFEVSWVSTGYPACKLTRRNP